MLIDAGWHLQVDAPRAAWLTSAPNRSNRNILLIPDRVAYDRQLRQFKILAARAVFAVSWCVVYKAILSEALAPHGVRVTTALALPCASMACALLGGGPVGITSNLACRKTPVRFLQSSTQPDLNSQGFINEDHGKFSKGSVRSQPAASSQQKPNVLSQDTLVDICEVQTESACSGWEAIETNHGEIREMPFEREREREQEHAEEFPLPITLPKERKHAEARMSIGSECADCAFRSSIKHVHSQGYLQLLHAVCRAGSKLCKQVTMHRPEMVKVACQGCRKRHVLFWKH